eukprot:GFYU01005825.1.p1 GENE.GFYU01005825.1~~GFYU01005825.1.p1  ORF type:complete len:268 (+),score=77.15 GFYU01005825.1:100-804(+)
MADTQVEAPKGITFKITPEDLANQPPLDGSGDTSMKDAKPNFPALSAKDMAGGKVEYRKVPVPAHRYTPLKENWMKLYTPIVVNMKLQIRMNTKTRNIELKTSDNTADTGSVQKSADFLRAFMLGFEVEDAIALLRMDDLYVDSFEIKDVKTLKGDHLSRAIGRIAGRAGKTKFTIENVTKTRIVLADQHIHILGSFQNIKVARDAVVDLILGSPPGKVYSKLRTVASRMAERF